MFHNVLSPYLFVQLSISRPRQGNLRSAFLPAQLLSSRRTAPRKIQNDFFPIPSAGTGLQLLRGRDAVLRQPAHHLPPRHFAPGPFFNNSALLCLSEYAGNPSDRLGQMGLHGFAVLLGCQIQHKVRLRGQLPGQTAAPELIQVPAPVHCQPGLHLQPVRNHPVKGPQQSVKTGEDAQMFPKIIQVCRFHHPGRHIAVLDTLISEDGRSKTAAQVHMLQPFHVLPCDCIVTLPEGPQRLRRHPLQDFHQPFRLLQESGQAVCGKAVRILRHFFGGGNDNAHESAPPGQSARFLIFSSRRMIEMPIKICPIPAIPEIEASSPRLSSVPQTWIKPLIRKPRPVIFSPN